MKKIIILLSLFYIPTIVNCQTCSFHETSIEKDICIYGLKGIPNNEPNLEIESIVKEIIDLMGVKKRFVLVECNYVSNCSAVKFNGVRYILYDKYFLQSLASRTKNWSNYFILAHEIAHHTLGHTDLLETDLSKRRERELEADEFAAYTLCMLGSTIYEAKEAIKLISRNIDDKRETHPSQNKRIISIEKGFEDASNNNPAIISYRNSSSEIESFFYKAIDSYRNRDYYTSINNFTEVIMSYDDVDLKKEAYYLRGLAYRDLKKYEEGITDFTRSIELGHNLAYSYFERAGLYFDIKAYKFAYSDYSLSLVNAEDSLYKHNALYLKSVLGLIQSLIIWDNEKDRSSGLKQNIQDLTLFIKQKERDKAYQYDDDLMNLYQIRGSAYYTLSNYDFAIDDFKMAIKNTDDNIILGELYYLLGISKLKDNRIFSYEQDLRKSCKYNCKKACYLLSK